jgi:hypothetical protein
MRCSRGGRAAVFLVVTLSILLLVAAGSTTAAPSPADSDGDGGKGGQDIAIPALDATAQLAEAGVDVAATELGPAGATAATLAALPLDDFRYDPQLTEGYAGDVCYGSMRPGTAQTFFELQRRFGGSAGTLYACRERWNEAEEPDCNGTLVDPRGNPGFYSTCWSNHAQGRALDLMSTTERGNAVVNWLLAPDARGNYSANARRLGVMQILWRDRCWNTDDDRGVLSVRRMRECGIGHFDHVHIDLTLAGAMGRTSYWGGTPKISRKDNGVFWWNNDTGEWRMQSWFNYSPTVRRTGAFLRSWELAVPGDWDKDGVDDDLLLWNRDNGRWSIRSWVHYRQRKVRAGNFWTVWDQLIPGDWDGNRRTNDLFMWDRDTGRWQVRSFSGGGSRLRTSGIWSTALDTIRVGDFDEDNRQDEMFVHDRQSGAYQIYSWNAFTPSLRRTATWPRAFDRFVIGDWDSDGELNDMLVLQSTTGRWQMMSWHGFTPTKRRAGVWSSRFKQFAAADLDGEGRVDDMLVRSRGTGRWQVIEWHYYRSRRQNDRVGLKLWDQLIPGQWG